MREEVERSGPGWLVTLLGASLLLFAGFAVGVVVGAAREEPELWLRHVSGETDSVTPDAAPPPADAPAPAAGESAPAPAPAPTTPAVEAAAPATPPPAAKTAPVPDVAAAPLPARSLELPPLGEAPKPGASKAAAPATTGRYAVQVGAFADGAQAQTLARNLERRGLPVQVLPGSGAKDSRWRVRVVPVASREEADRIAAKLRQEKLPTWILAEGR